jgi:arylsulfatase A-like enzyme
MTPENEIDRGGLFVTLRAGLNAGLAVGALLGFVDGAVASFRTPVEGFGTILACMCAASVTYGIVYAVLGMLAGLAMHRWLRRRDLPGRLSALLVLCLGGGLFLELFWWSREWVLYGVPITDPRRLAAAVLMLVLCWGLGFALVNLGSRLSPTWKWSAAGAVVLTWLIGGPYLLFAKQDVEELGRLNDRNRDLPNVLFIVHDALRADVLGCYGNDRVKTPVFDTLAARGVLFENAFVQAPFTGSSFGSFFTGKYPRRHGFVKMVPGMRMEPSVTIASHLGSAKFAAKDVTLQHGDYHSVTFMTGALSQASGLMRGFDSYFEAMMGHDLVDADNPWSVLRSELVLFTIKSKVEQRLLGEPVKRAAIDWFERNGRKRFFAMAHFYATHTPYDPPKEMRELYCDPAYDGPVDAFYAHHRQLIESGKAAPTEADKRQIQNLYYAGVTHGDRMTGELIEALERAGVLHNTIVVLTSDHGEELGDHGLWEHNHMFNTNLRVPLIVVAPGMLPQGARVKELVESVDLLPSLCEMLGLEVPHEERRDEQGRNYGEVDGKSFVGLAHGRVESLREISFSENGKEMSAQDLEWKLIVRAADLANETLASIEKHDLYPARLFHLAKDSHEVRDVLEAERGHAERLFAHLRTWDMAMPIPRHSISQSDRDREQEAHLLNALGYSDGVGQGVESVSPQRPRDPSPSTKTPTDSKPADPKPEKPIEDDSKAADKPGGADAERERKP